MVETNMFNLNKIASVLFIFKINIFYVKTGHFCTKTILYKEPFL